MTLAGELYTQNCANTFGTTYKSTTYAFNVFIAELEENRTRVTVNTSITAIKDATLAFGEGVMTCYSNGRLETAILDKIS